MPNRTETLGDMLEEFNREYSLLIQSRPRLDTIQIAHVDRMLHIVNRIYRIGEVNNGLPGLQTADDKAQ